MKINKNIPIRHLNSYLSLNWGEFISNFSSQHDGVPDTGQMTFAPTSGRRLFIILREKWLKSLPFFTTNLNQNFGLQPAQLEMFLRNNFSLAYHASLSYQLIQGFLVFSFFSWMVKISTWVSTVVGIFISGRNFDLVVISG